MRKKCGLLVVKTDRPHFFLVVIVLLAERTNQRREARI